MHTTQDFTTSEYWQQTDDDLALLTQLSNAVSLSFYRRAHKLAHVSARSITSQTQKACYLPFSAFLLKPSQRLSHYKLLIESKQNCRRLGLGRGPGRGAGEGSRGGGPGRGPGGYGQPAERQGKWKTARLASPDDEALLSLSVGEVEPTTF